MKLLKQFVMQCEVSMDYSIDTTYLKEGHFNQVIQKVILDIQFYLDHRNFTETTYNGICLDYVFWWLGAAIDNHYNKSREHELMPLLFEEALYKKLVFTPQLKKYCIDSLLYFMCYQNRVNKVYDLIDDKSKETFDWLLKRKLAYALTGELSFEMYPQCFDVPKATNLKIDDIGRYCVDGYLINSDACVDIWEFEQYALYGLCEPQKDDIVLSIGAYKGETAIWFSNKIGNNGHVYAFEPNENNQSVLIDNLQLNDIVNVTLVKEGIWSHVGKQFFERNGALSTIVDVKCDVDKNCAINVDTIDNFVSDQNIGKVDFIKMDIEGGEFNALQGAVETIIKYKPKLAISIYHSAHDFIDIPLLIHYFVPEYKMSISHKKMDNSFTETILFAYL